jgi:hypothetical protein
VEQVAQGVAARRRLEQVGGDLVQERLKGVEVVPVDQRHVDVGVFQPPGRGDAAEAAPEHEHLRAPGPRLGRSRRRRVAGR